jgi:hypothetical protein
MLKVFPIQDKAEQQRLCERCGVTFRPELLAYQATVEDVFAGVCQFKLAPGGGIVYDLAPDQEKPVDLEAMFVMGRAALNFIGLCGIHHAFFDGDVEVPGETLIRAIGFTKNEADRWEMDLTDFFTTPCKHCKS